MRFAVTLHVGRTHEPNDVLNHSYIRFLEGIGIVPILIPNVIQDPYLYALRMGIDGVVLTGGNDVAPDRYSSGLTPTTSVAPERDALEIQLLELAMSRCLPVFGICRGMQLINVYFGGSLVPDIRSHSSQMIEHVRRSHPNSTIDSEVQTVLGTQEFTVNSFHNQGITETTLSPTLRPFVVSTLDGLVEGLLHPTRPVLGIQWHPERPGGSPDWDRALVRRFLDGSLWARSKAS